ncbi:hypothetical protein I3843_15G062100 [Carya illinoinensis]|nr:hypothetical protein I3843_15G062100 [Carya illinoinensis]
MDFQLQNLSINIIVAGLFSMLLVSSIIKRLSRGTKTKRAPEPAGAWPLIGHLHLLGGSQPHITLGSLVEKYGPAFSIRIGVRSALVISSWELAKECFTTNDVALCSRPRTVAAKHLSYDYALFGLSPYGSYWREIRRLTSMEILSNRRLELLKDVRASETETSLKELYKLWTKRNDGSDHVLVEMKQWFGDFSLNMILRKVVGKRCSSTTVASDEHARRCQKVFREFFHFLGLFVVGDAIPYLGWLDLGGHEKAMKRTAKDMDFIVTEWLEEHQKKRASGEAKDQQHDFMDVMLSVLDSTGNHLVGFDADTVNKATCLAIIVGGTDTIMVSLTWALALLLNNHHALRKAQEEMEVHVGKGRLVTEEDISKLSYLQAIVKEVLRLYPPGPTTAREAIQDCTIGGYHVQKGSLIIVNMWKIQTDPRVWSDPLEFKPERFLTTHKEVDVRGQNFELLPFGSGRRGCPGVSLALKMLSLCLANLIHAFEISNPSNLPIDMTGSAGLTNMKSTPLEVVIKPRLPSNLYE